MNIDDLTIGEVKQLQQLIGSNAESASKGIQHLIGQEVIIRTYSAGVWFGVLKEKDGNEVILNNARRMWQWWAAKSISLSGVAVYGINQEKSKICPPVASEWLEAIEIIELTEEAKKSLLEAKDVEAE